MESQITLTRRWIMSAYQAGKGTKEIAAIFGRCESAVRRVKQNYRERGTADPLLHLRGRKGKFSDEIKTRLGQFVTDHPDATLKEIKQRLGLDVSLSTVDRWLKKLELSFKKSVCTPPSRTWVREALLPGLRKGDIVVMDNLPAHKRPAVRAMIEEAGCEVWLLPAYSPDWNPIEMMWSKVKQLIRGAEARRFDALVCAVFRAMGAVTADDAAGFFRHCGYRRTID